MGWEYVPGRHNDPERFDEQPTRKRDKEFQRGRRLDLPDRPGAWTKERIEKEKDGFRAIFEDAKSWDEIESALEERGLRLDRKGQGAVIAGDDGEMKLSILGKAVRLKELERRFGERKERPERQRTQARSEVFEQVAKATAETDLAFTMNKAGLVSQAQLDRSLRERDAAVEALQETKTASERLLEGIFEVSSADEEKERQRERERRRRVQRDRDR